ncbi:MAG TPA: isocitrate lyase/phosphoenolpyruvate mutase family protein [Stellaceae bacterium]|jgi:carboxyvinyl-carboxyphosphonate phosphorylmutase|nr:isocitrate lyase/phosphoenolpyruvate mutase family protein [Stellaceae bacterium]
MEWSERRQRFRSLLKGSRCLHPGSVFDPISARIAEQVGFEIGMFAGSIASFTVLGNPDLILLTLSEFAEQAYRICRAAKLPVLVDADHGYGNALNVMRTVEELETAGIAALSIEDTALPANFGAAEEARLIPIAEGVGKMRAALAARQDPGLVIAGRTQAISVTGIEDTIARAKAYAEAGVDALFFVGLKKRADLDAIAAAVNRPIIIGGGAGELDDLDYLAARGVRVALQGHQPFLAAVRAVYDTLKALHQGVKPKDLPGVASPDLMKMVTREAEHRRWMHEFLTEK